jgi:hypothetical protein
LASMNDVLYIVLTLAFFVIALLILKAVGRL